MLSFIHSFIRSFVCSFIRSFIQFFISWSSTRRQALYSNLAALTLTFSKEVIEEKRQLITKNEPDFGSWQGLTWQMTPVSLFGLHAALARCQEVTDELPFHNQSVSVYHAINLRRSGTKFNYMLMWRESFIFDKVKQLASLICGIIILHLGLHMKSQILKEMNNITYNFIHYLLRPSMVPLSLLNI